MLAAVAAIREGCRGASGSAWISPARLAGGGLLGDILLRMTICQARAPDQIAIARELFREYADSLGIDLSFQGFAAELAGLPGAYAPPRGRLLLALDGDCPSGCVALRSLGDEVCEMKRLFVRPGFRRKGIGLQLAKRILREARAIGYQTMRLDTLATMRGALKLYEALGFVRCPPYYQTPLPDTVFMQRQL